MKVIPVEPTGKFVTSSCLSVGRSLTFVSDGALASTVIDVLVPSFLKTAYDVIGQPPSLIGSTHDSIIEVVVESSRVGAVIRYGAMQARVASSVELGPSPLKLNAVILKR